MDRMHTPVPVSEVETPEKLVYLPKNRDYRVSHIQLARGES